MHKKMSRIVVLLLVICLTLGNVVPVLAADDTGSTDTVTPTAEASPSAEAEASASPAATPAAETSAAPAVTPTAAPTPAAKTEAAETTASPEASASATATATAEPSAAATAETTEAPTAEPSASATATAEATEEPTATPTAETAVALLTGEEEGTPVEETEEPKITFVPKAYEAAPVDEKAVSGIKASGGNFTLDTKKTTAMISGGKVYITLTAETTADYLYIGSEDALKAAKDSGTIEAAAAVVNNGKKSFHFVFDSCKVGTGTIGVKNNLKAPVYAVNSDGSYTTVTLTFPRSMPVNNKVTAIAYRSAPNADGELALAKDAMKIVSEKGDTFAAFTVGEATAVKVNGIIYATIYVLPKTGTTTFNYSYFSIGSKSRLDNGSEISAAAGVVTADKTKQAFHFTLDPAQLNEEGKVEVCYIKNTYNTTVSNWNSSPYYLKVSVDQIEEREAKVVPNPVSYAAAPVAEKALSGLTAAMQNASAAPFTVASATAIRCGETSYLTLAVDSVDGAFPYTYLYFGTEAALKDAIANGGKYPVVAPKTENGQQSYHFTLPSTTAAGTTLTAYAVKADGFKTTYEPLTLTIPEIPVGVKFTEKSYDAAPVAEQEAAGLYAAEPGTTESSALFPISSATAVICLDTLYVTLKVKSEDYTWLYLGEKTPLESGGVFEAVKSADGAYHFTLDASDAGKTLSVCAGKDDGSYTPLDLILPTDISAATAAPRPAISALPGGLKEANIKVVKEDGTEFTEFKMFAADKTGLIVTADKLLVHFETANVSYDRMYFGSKDDAFKYYVQGTERTDGGYVFEFELPLSYRGGRNPVCLGKPDGSSWYTKANLYINIPADAGDPGENLPDAGIRMLSGGSQVEQSFKITSSSAMLLNGKVYCTITGTAYASKTADKLYLGDRSDKDKSGYVTGTVNGDGTTTFVYTVNAERQGSYTPAVLGYSDGTWDTSQSYFLNVPNFNGTFDASAFTDGVYDLFGYAYPQNGGIPVDAGATLTVSGDTITIKYVTRSSGYSKLYFGSVTDDEATRDKNAVSAEILNPDEAYSYRYFSVTLPKNALAEKIPFVSCDKNGKWSTKQDYLLIPRYLPRIGGATDPDPVDPSDPSSVIKDGGTYYTTAETGAAMFKVRRVVITAKDGKYEVTLTLNGTSYDYLYPGTGTQADAVDRSEWAAAKVVSGTIDGETRDDWHTYTITVDKLTNPLAVTSHSQKNDKWYDRSITLDLENLKRTAEDGQYSVTAECGAAMFKIVDTKLNIVNGAIMATLTLGGTGYDYLYPGTGEEAANDKDNWVPFAVDENGKYTYTIPVSELDKPITISSHSLKNNIWYDRTVTFDASSLKKIGDATDPVDPNPTPTPTPTPVPTDPTKPDDESDHETDATGSTSRVNNSTTLKDGTYAPDSFSFSGGSGRTRIVCDKVTVKNGQAYATIRFVSSSGNPPQFSYVKASGNTYYSNDGCTFTIPVELNKNNRILGMTTKMSSAHEIEYIIFVQLKTNANNQKDNNTDTLSTEAPEIMGLTFKEEIKLDHAQYLKLFRYEGDIVLAEIDVVSGTVLDTEKAKAEIEKADKAAAAESTEEIVAEEESTDNAQIKADYVAELYKQNVLRYLLVPEGTELPAGLEKQLIIVTLPVKSLYVMDETPVDTLDIFEALHLVKVFGAEKSENETLAAALTDGSTLYGGTWDKPEYKLLVKNETDLVLTSGKLLPLSEETLKARKETAPADAEELTAVEYRDRLYDLADRFAVLDIPMLIDRSADEADALAQADWLNLYGILLGDETTANRMIREITSREG